ncbi:MAG: ABC transporter permease, partial [Ruminiclostridium sp.]|nr:ABC transporter permease [Ruminiclostridium sp.]
MKNITAVFLKQVKETFRNKAILIHFVMFPVLVIIMENAIKLENMPEHFFVKLFAIMFVGMAPLICMSSIISEEKENNTLRVLMMSNVKPFEYLIGVGAYVWIMCIIGAVVFAVCGDYSGKD